MLASINISFLFTNGNKSQAPVLPCSTGFYDVAASQGTRTSGQAQLLTVPLVEKANNMGTTNNSVFQQTIAHTWEAQNSIYSSKIPILSKFIPQSTGDNTHQMYLLGVHYAAKGIKTFLFYANLPLSLELIHLLGSQESLLQFLNRTLIGRLQIKHQPFVFRHCGFRQWLQKLTPSENLWRSNTTEKICVQLWLLSLCDVSWGLKDRATD